MTDPIMMIEIDIDVKMKFTGPLALLVKLLFGLHLVHMAVIATEAKRLDGGELLISTRQES